MENIINVIVQNEFLEENLNPIGVGHIAIVLLQPLAIADEIRERRPVARNTNYFENTIPLYIGDLFVEHFRMSRNGFEHLTNIVGNAEILPAHMVIPLEKKLLFTLWVLAKPECFLAAGDRFGLARSSAHYIFKEIVEILIRLMPQFIVWPQNHNEAIRVFHERSNGFPGVVAAIDGCHIPIKQPVYNGVDYYNRKEFHSIILQGTCNHLMIFIDVFVGLPGRLHDARVFRNSDLYRKITDENLLPENLHIIGDSAYPLMTNLLTPYRDNGHLNIDQINYNNKLSSARSIIERAFGRLKGKFRRLKYLDILDPEFGTQIIVAACVLHNFIIIHDTDNEMFHPDEGLPQQEFRDNGEFFGNRDFAEEKRINITNLLRN